MKKSRKKCYYCGKQIGTTGSREHVPPQMIFSAFKGIDKITVYSCEKHNTEKEVRDRAIVTLLLKGATYGKSELDPAISSSLSKLATMIIETEKHNPDRPILEKLPEKLRHLTNDFPYIKAEHNIEDWMRMITAGLVYNAVGDFEDTIIWDDAVVWCPTFVPTDVTPLPDEDFEYFVETLRAGVEANFILKTRYKWDKGWKSGKNPYPPKIYDFQMSFDETEFCFRHQFFDGIEWYVYSKAPRKTVEKIRRRLESE